MCTVPRFRNSFICTTRENNFLYVLQSCVTEKKGMTTHARGTCTSVIYNSQMSGVEMPGDLHVSMLIVY